MNDLRKEIRKISYFPAYFEGLGKVNKFHELLHCHQHSYKKQKYKRRKLIKLVNTFQEENLQIYIYIIFWCDRDKPFSLFILIK